MKSLILGIVIWSLVHYIPATAVNLRARLISKLGLNAYKGLFSLLMIGAIALMVSGWKAAPMESWYIPASWGPRVTIAGMLLASLFFFAPYVKSSLSRVFRHPQLAGVVLFGVAHLFSNGESRSVILFGGLALWALLQMILINRRDGAWVKPGPDLPTRNSLLIAVGIGFFVLLMFSHHWLFGVSPVPYW
jgi:uncharacterized membrane protein